MSSTEKLIEKLKNRSLEKSELETLLHRFGFSKIHGKGSHEVWGRKDIPNLHFVIATHNKEIPFYQLKQIENSLKKRGVI